MGSISQVPPVDGRSINDYGKAFDFLRSARDERFYIILVRNDMTLYDPYMHTYGQPDSVRVDMTTLTQYIDVFAERGFVVLHNHPPPSQAIPSKADIRLTMNLVKIGKSLGKPLFNHCIVSEKEDRYFSDLFPEVLV